MQKARMAIRKGMFNPDITKRFSFIIAWKSIILSGVLIEVVEFNSRRICGSVYSTELNNI